MLSFYKTSGAVAVAETFAPNAIIKIHQIKFTLAEDGVGGESLTADIDGVDGNAFDGRLLNEPMGGVNCLIQSYEAPILLDKGDSLDFAYLNSGAVVWGLEIAYERIAQ